MPFLALGLPPFLTFDMDLMGKHRRPLLIILLIFITFSFDGAHDIIGRKLRLDTVGTSTLPYFSVFRRPNVTLFG